MAQAQDRPLTKYIQVQDKEFFDDINGVIYTREIRVYSMSKDPRVEPRLLLRIDPKMVKEVVEKARLERKCKKKAFTVRETRTYSFDGHDGIVSVEITGVSSAYHPIRSYAVINVVPVMERDKGIMLSIYSGGFYTTMYGVFLKKIAVDTINGGLVIEHKLYKRWLKAMEIMDRGTVDEKNEEYEKFNRYLMKTGMEFEPLNLPTEDWKVTEGFHGLVLSNDVLAIEFIPVIVSWW